MNVQTCIQCATVLAGGLPGASVFGLATGTDYGVVFGALPARCFMSPRQPTSGRIRLVAYFITSFIVGVLGAGLIGTKLQVITHKTTGCTWRSDYFCNVYKSFSLFLNSQIRTACSYSFSYQEGIKW